MKHLSLLKSMTLVCGAMLTAVATTSCSSKISPTKAADTLIASNNISVFSSNDVNDPNIRNCKEVGQLPERAQRALRTWLKHSTVKKFTYIYPQYYISVVDDNGKLQGVWGLCVDGKANLVGVLIPNNGTLAWDLPHLGAYHVYVCDTAQRKELSRAVMDSLADAGYDSYRIESRKARGLVDKRYLLSKPLSDAQEEALRKARLAEAVKRNEAAKAARRAAGLDEEGADEFTPEDLDLGGDLDADLGDDLSGDMESGADDGSSSDEESLDDTTDFDL